MQGNPEIRASATAKVIMAMKFLFSQSIFKTYRCTIMNVLSDN